MRGEDPEGCSRDKGIRTIDLCFRKATLTETCRFSLWHQCGWLTPGDKEDVESGVRDNAASLRITEFGFEGD